MKRERSLTFRIARNATSILASGAAAEAINAYTLALSAVALGTAGFGRLSAAVAFMEPFETGALFGLPVVAVTLAARRQGADGKLLGSMAAAHVGLVLIGGGAALILALLTGRQAMLPLLALFFLNMLALPVRAPANVPFQYRQEVHRTVAIPATAALLRLVLTHVAVATLSTPVTHQAAGTVGALAGGFILFAVCRRAYRLRWSFDRGLAAELLKRAWPIAALEVVVMVYSRASYFLLNDAGAAIQGEFAAADRLSRPILALATALVASALPTVARLAASDDAHRLWSIYRQTLLRSLQVVVPIAATAAFAAPWLIGRFLPDYLGARVPFQILVVGVTFMFVNQISSMFIIAIGRFRTLLIVAFVNLAVYLVLANTLIPRYQAIGAALSTTAMEATNCVAQLVVLTLLLRKKAQSGGVSSSGQS